MNLYSITGWTANKTYSVNEHFFVVEESEEAAIIKAKAIIENSYNLRIDDELEAELYPEGYSVCDGDY